MTQVKICGMRRREDIEAVNKYRPEYCGMIMSPGFRRSVTLEQARRLRGALDEGIQMVGVYVNADPGEIVSAVRDGVIDVIQLHGQESNGYIHRLRNELEDRGVDASIIKACKIETGEDLGQALLSRADIILLDNGTGTGQTFNWNVLGEIERPWFLAGGLTSQNVGEAIGKFAPTGVDVSSAVETEGWKDPAKIAAFIEEVRK